MHTSGSNAPEGYPRNEQWDQNDHKMPGLAFACYPFFAFLVPRDFLALVEIRRSAVPL